MPRVMVGWSIPHWIYVKAPYDEDFTAAIKRLAPVAWDKDRKMWWVGGQHVDRVRQLVRAYFDEPVDPGQSPCFIGAGASPAPPKQDPSDPYRLLGVTREAPFEVVKAAYRALALLVHPDRGGQPEHMVVINNAFDAVRKDFGE